MRRLEKQIFFEARKLLPEQSEEVYELLHYVGEELPEKFDHEDLSDVVRSLTDVIAFNPERLPLTWMQQNPTLVAKNLSKISELLEKVSANSNYVQAFRDAYGRARRIKKRVATIK